MIDTVRLATFWLEGAREDWAVASDLVARGRARHGLFFAHLSLEKLLKAVVCRRTGDLAPRLHNLVRLAELAEIGLDDVRLDTLAEMNAFSIAGRYPEGNQPMPTGEEAAEYMSRAAEVVAWLETMC